MTTREKWYHSYRMARSMKSAIYSGSPPESVKYLISSFYSNMPKDDRPIQFQWLTNAQRILNERYRVGRQESELLECSAKIKRLEENIEEIFLVGVAFNDAVHDCINTRHAMKYK